MIVGALDAVQFGLIRGQPPLGEGMVEVAVSTHLFVRLRHSVVVVSQPAGCSLQGLVAGALVAHDGSVPGVHRPLEDVVGSYVDSLDPHDSSAELHVTSGYALVSTPTDHSVVGPVPAEVPRQPAERTMEQSGAPVVEAPVVAMHVLGSIVAQLVDVGPLGATVTPDTAGELGGAAVMKGPETAQAITAATIATTTVTRRATSSRGDVRSSPSAEQSRVTTVRRSHLSS